MRKVLFFLLTLLVGVGVFYFFVKTVGLEGIKEAFTIFSGPKGIAIFGTTLLIMLIGAFKCRIVLKSQGYKVPLKDLLAYRLASFSVLFFAPMLVLGGEIFRAYALKEKKEVPWGKAMSSVVIDRISEWTCNLVVVLFGVFFFISRIGALSQNLKIFLISALFTLVFGAVFFYFRSFRKESIVRIFMKRNKKNHFLDIEKEVFKFFKPKNKAMWKTLVISFLRTLSAVFRCWLILIFLGKGLAFLPAFPVLSFYFLAILIPIPAALGSHDALQAFSFSALGFGADSGAAFAMIIRAAELMTALVGAVILFRVGMSLIKDIFFKKIDLFLDSITNSKK